MLLEKMLIYVSLCIDNYAIDSRDEKFEYILLGDFHGCNIIHALDDTRGM